MNAEQHHRELLTISVIGYRNIEVHGCSLQLAVMQRHRDVGTSCESACEHNPLLRPRPISRKGLMQLQHR